MPTINFAPFYQSTVGFDEMFSQLDQLVGVEDSAPNYPPYDIERTDENAYRISVAVAGFAEADLSIEVEENTLTIRGEKQQPSNERTANTLHRGIATRAFQRRFQLAEHVGVRGASLDNGLLNVDLLREVPEAMKPRAIPIAHPSTLVEASPALVAA
jgi:molecular chaperone IbpA